MKYIVKFYGYTGGEEFPTLTLARQCLRSAKKSDRKICKQRFGQSSVSVVKDGYVVTFGANIYSAANIFPA